MSGEGVREVVALMLRLWPHIEVIPEQIEAFTDRMLAVRISPEAAKRALASLSVEWDRSWRPGVADALEAIRRAQADAESAARVPWRAGDAMRRVAHLRADRGQGGAA